MVSLFELFIGSGSRHTPHKSNIRRGHELSGYMQELISKGIRKSLMLEDGIEPSLKDFQSLVLPLNYSSTILGQYYYFVILKREISITVLNPIVEPAGIEPTFIDCKSIVLPLNYGPFFRSRLASISPRIHSKIP